MAAAVCNVLYNIQNLHLSTENWGKYSQFCRDARVSSFLFSIHFSYLVDSHFWRRFITRFCIGGRRIKNQSIWDSLHGRAHSIFTALYSHCAALVWRCRNGNLIRQNKSSSLWGLRNPTEREVSSVGNKPGFPHLPSPCSQKAGIMKGGM